VARIAGVNIPTNKRVIIALTYIHGIGRTTAVRIADKLGIDHARRVQDLTDEEVARIREYLLRGGFLMLDDFHGTQEWGSFQRGMSKIFPDRPIVDVGPEDEIFHTLYDAQPGEQIPGVQFVYSGRTYERDGVQPEWRGIYDDEGRLMVMINHNMDLGDAWEHADLPEYPERYTAMAYRMGINYILYSMTH